MTQKMTDDHSNCILLGKLISADEEKATAPTDVYALTGKWHNEQYFQLSYSVKFNQALKWNVMHCMKRSWFEHALYNEINIYIDIDLDDHQWFVFVCVRVARQQNGYLYMINMNKDSSFTI